MNIINIYDAKSHFSHLISSVESGKEIIIGRYGKPIAKLVPYKESKVRARLGGQWKNKLWLAEDFNDTPKDLIDSFYDEE